uniref:Protein XRP2 n=1 Tax=Mesocestoides corti TaxID=53468 RepID=A0A5K3F6I7_MESCO
MGSNFSQLYLHNKKKVVVKGKAGHYSWETRNKVESDNSTIADRVGTICGRLPGTINGQQFRIRNCKDVFIYVYNHVNTVTVDDCVNCTVVIGAVQTSLFIRDCEDCNVLAACKQYRIRGCKNIASFVACGSEPIIESSSSIHFAPFQLFYPELIDQFKAAGLNPFNCSYSSVHDFTPKATASPNYDFFPTSEDIAKRILLPNDLASKFSLSSARENAELEPSELLDQLKATRATLDPDLSIVPTVFAALLIDHARTTGDFALIGLFYHSGVEDNARALIKTLLSQSVFLVRTRCAKYSPEDLTRIFGDSTLAAHSRLGFFTAASESKFY